MLKINENERISWDKYLLHPFFEKNFERINLTEFNRKCKVHFEPFELYCINCNKNICEKCKNNHKEHQFMLFSDTRLNQSELNQMENLMKIFENDINNLNKIKTDIERIINKMKIINKNNSIYKDNLKHSLKKRKKSLTNPKEEALPRSKIDSHISLIKSKEKESNKVKVTAANISLKQNKKKSRNTSLEVDSKNIVKTINIEVPRLTKRMKAIFNYSNDLDYDGDVYNLRLSKGINVDVRSLTNLMRLNVNDQINLDDYWIREKKWNKYGGYEIGVPDYHLVYENRGNEIEGGDINIDEDKGKVNIKGGKYDISGKGLGDIDIGFNNNLEGDDEEYNIENDHMGYSQPMNFDVEIPEDLNAIPNSKIRPRQKSSMNAYEYERKMKNSLRFKSLPDKKTKAYVMNYKILPTFEFTITQMPKENIPLCKDWFPL